MTYTALCPVEPQVLNICLDDDDDENDERKMAPIFSGI